MRLKRPPVALFGSFDATANEFCFRLSPNVFISLSALAKRPGEEMVGEEVQLLERYHPSSEMAPYERLLGDALRGDRTLFGNEEGVEAAWRIVDAIAGETTPPALYAQHSWGPTEADRLALDRGGWSLPTPPTEPERPTFPGN